MQTTCIPRRVLLTKYWVPHYEDFFDENVIFVQMKRRDRWRKWTEPKARAVLNYPEISCVGKVRAIRPLLTDSDVIFQADLSSFWNLFAIAASLRWARTFALWIEKPARIGNRQVIAFRLAHRLGIPILAVGQSSMVALQQAGVPATSLKNLPYNHGVDAPILTRVPSRDSGAQLRILCDGSQPHVKGTHALVAAVAELRRSGVDCSVGVLASCEETKQLFGDMAEVRHLPHVEPDQIFPLLEDYEVLVMTPLSERWGMLAEEAMAAGLTVVSNRVPGVVGQLVLDDNTGLVVDSDDHLALTDALRSLAGDEELLYRLRCNALRTVRECRHRYTEQRLWGYATINASVDT